MERKIPASFLGVSIHGLGIPFQILTLNITS
jgi:hypothetical protein